jgi:hypothetical protein
MSGAPQTLFVLTRANVNMAEPDICTRSTGLFDLCTLLSNWAFLLPDAELRTSQLVKQKIRDHPRNLQWNPPSSKQSIAPMHQSFPKAREITSSGGTFLVRIKHLGAFPRRQRAISSNVQILNPRAWMQTDLWTCNQRHPAVDRIGREK